jgi:multiple sugar transport system ATP-binding protein
LFDEPLSNLDAKLRVQMRAELKKLHRRLQTTVIYVTHDQEEAMTLGDRIVVMKSGVVHQCDTPLEVYDRPRDRFVASFVGTPAMNFFEGRVQVGDGEVLLETGSGVVRLPQRLGERLAGRRGEPFVLGVRSEGLSFSRDADGAGSPKACVNRWRMGVAVVEPLGSEKDVHLQTCDGVQAVARVPSHVSVVEGNDVDVFLDASRMHVFEPGEAGLNIGLNGYGAQSSVH